MRSSGLQDISALRAMGCRRFGVVCAVLLWLATTASASPAELYTDDVPKDNIIAQGEHYVDPGLYPPINDDDQFWRKDLYLMKMLKTLQREEPVLDERLDYAESPWRDALGGKASTAKRWVSSLNTGGSTSATTAAAQKAQLQRKLKLKKGRGYSSLCYFKLCSFRRY